MTNAHETPPLGGERRINSSDPDFWTNPKLWTGGGQIRAMPPDPFDTIASLTRMLEAAQKALAEEKATGNRFAEQIMELQAMLATHTTLRLAAQRLTGNPDGSFSQADFEDLRALVTDKETP